MSPDQCAEIRATFNAQPFDGSGMLPAEWGRSIALQLVAESPSGAVRLVHDLRNILLPMQAAVQRGDGPSLPIAFRGTLRLETLANALAAELDRSAKP